MASKTDSEKQKQIGDTQMATKPNNIRNRKHLTTEKTTNKSKKVSKLMERTSGRFILHRKKKSKQKRIRNKSKKGSIEAALDRELRKTGKIAPSSVIVSYVMFWNSVMEFLETKVRDAYVKYINGLSFENKLKGMKDALRACSREKALRANARLTRENLELFIGCFTHDHPQIRSLVKQAKGLIKQQEDDLALIESLKTIFAKIDKIHQEKIRERNQPHPDFVSKIA